MRRSQLCGRVGEGPQDRVLEARGRVWCRERGWLFGEYREGWAGHSAPADPPGPFLSLRHQEAGDGGTD